MTHKLTLFLVCAFEFTLILFVAAWTAWANTAPTYNCVTKEIIQITEGDVEKKPNFNFMLIDNGSSFIFTLEKNNSLLLDRQMAIQGRVDDNIFSRSLFASVGLSKNKHLHISVTSPGSTLIAYAACDLF